MSVDEPRGATHRGSARLGPEQRLQDRGPSERELRAQVLSHGRPRARGNRHRASPHLPAQDAASVAGGGRYEEVLAGQAAARFQLPVASGLLLLDGLALVRTAASLGASTTAAAGTTGAASTPGPCFLTEEGVGAHVTGRLAVAPFPRLLMLLFVVGI